MLLVCEDELVVEGQAKESGSSAKPCSGLAASDTQRGSQHPCGSKRFTIEQPPRASGSKESDKREGTACPCQFGKVEKEAFSGGHLFVMRIHSAFRSES